MTAREPTTQITHDPAATETLAAELAARLPRGAVIALHGSLGAGKTCFARGLARGLGIEQPVTSPTYTLIQEYDGPVPLIHVDLYRIGSADEALHLGLDEYFDGDGVVAIEWAERAGEALPERTIHVRMEPGRGDHERIITIERTED